MFLLLMFLFLLMDKVKLFALHFYGLEYKDSLYKFANKVWSCLRKSVAKKRKFDVVLKGTSDAKFTFT